MCKMTEKYFENCFKVYSMIKYKEVSRNPGSRKLPYSSQYIYPKVSLLSLGSTHNTPPLLTQSSCTARKLAVPQVRGVH